MPIQFLDFSYTSAVWIFDSLENNTLWSDGHIERGIVHNLYSLKITTNETNITTQPIILPSIKLFRNLQVLEIKNANITGLTDLGNTEGPAVIRMVTIRNTQIKTLDNINMDNVRVLTLINNPVLQFSIIPTNIVSLFIRNQSLQDLYLNSNLVHLIFEKNTCINRIFNISKTNLDEVYIEDDLKHPYDFSVSLLENETDLEWFTRIICFQNQQYHYDTYLSFGSIPSRIIVPSDIEISPIIQVFGLSANYPRRMAEFMVDTRNV
jgi:hypothetical protein